MNKKQWLDYLNNDEKLNINNDHHWPYISTLYLDKTLKFSERYYITVVGHYLIRKGLVKNISLVKGLLLNSFKKFNKVIILCGISGTGKSTYIKNNYSHYKIISMDDIRYELCGNRADQSKNKEVAEIALYRFEKALKNKENVVWDATNTRKVFREQLYSLTRKYKSLTELHVLLAKESTIRKRNKERTHAVPDNVITKQIKQFEFPFNDETHIVKYIDME